MHVIGDGTSGGCELQELPPRDEPALVDGDEGVATGDVDLVFVLAAAEVATTGQFHHPLGDAGVAVHPVEMQGVGLHDDEVAEDVGVDELLIDVELLGPDDLESQVLDVLVVEAVSAFRVHVRGHFHGGGSGADGA